MNELDLFELVETFSNFGPHRTGAGSSEQVNDWLSRILTAQSAKVSVESFTYPHFTSAVTDLTNSTMLEAELLYFSWTGDQVVTKPYFCTVDAQAAEHDILKRISRHTKTALANGHDCVLVETESLAGGLCGINRAFQQAGVVPIILAAPGSAQRLFAAPVRIRCQGDCHDRSVENIIAHFPGPQGTGLAVVTTPISGWFGCAGERGTGLALAINVAQYLSQELAVDLVLTRGHEIGYLGGYAFVKSYSGKPEFVLHLGSCLANRSADVDSICFAPIDQMQRVLQSLAPLQGGTFTPANPVDENNWQGESKCWASEQYPILSIAGQAPLFHTQSDLPHAATSPEHLAQMLAILKTAALQMTR